MGVDNRCWAVSVDNKCLHKEFTLEVGIHLVVSVCCVVGSREGGWIAVGVLRHSLQSEDVIMTPGSVIVGLWSSERSWIER